MDSKMFIVGLALGMVGGALIVANSQKARQAVKNGQEQISRKAEEMAKNSNCNCKEQGEVKSTDKPKTKE